MASALRSPVLWILITCVLVILGISLLFESQEADTDWRRRRWDGSESAAATTPVAAAEVAAPATDPVRRVGMGVDHFTAKSDLAVLRTFLQSAHSSDADIITFLHAVAAAYGNLQSLTPPGAVTKREAAEHADFDRQAGWLILKALRLVRRRGDDERNTRAEVNVQAAQVLGKLSSRMNGDMRHRISKYVMRTIDGWEQAKYRIEFRVLEAASQALADLRQPVALEWMVHSFSHTKNSEPHILRLIAAHKAMLLFPNAETEGKLRYEIVKQMIKTYNGVEWASGNPGASADFWGRVGSGVVAVLHHFAGATAAHPGGEPFTKVSEFEAWFREHKNVRQAPWMDAKKGTRKNK